MIKKEIQNIDFKKVSTRFILEKAIFLIIPIILSLFLIFGFSTKKFDILAFVISILIILVIIFIFKITKKVRQNKEHLQCFICNNDTINKYKGFTRIVKIPLCEEHFSQFPKEVFQKEDRIYYKYFYMSLYLSIIYFFAIYLPLFIYGLELGINRQSLENLLISVVLIDFLFLPIQVLMNLLIAKKFIRSIKKVKK